MFPNIIDNSDQLKVADYFVSNLYIFINVNFNSL